MKKRFLAIALTIAMVGGCLVGCGSDSSTPATEDSNATEETTDDSTEAEDTSDADPIQALIDATDGTVSLVVWAGEEDQDITKELTDSFAAQYPDVTFDIQVGVQSESTAKDTVLADAEAAADVFTYADDQTLELVNAGALQEVVNTYTYDVKSASVQSAIDGASVNNTLYAYPMTADNGYFLYYDKSVYSEDDVKTMESLVEKAEAAGKSVGMEVSNGWYLYSFFKAAGLELALNDDGQTNSCTWNEAGGTDVAQAIIDLGKNKGFTNAADADIQTGVTNGKICAAISGTWNAEAFGKAWGDNLAATVLPTINIGGEDKQMWSFAGSKLIGVNAHSKFVGWSMLLAEWLTNKDNQILRFQKRGYGPANKEALESDEVSSNVVIAAVGAQQEFAVPQLVGGNFWDPAASLGKILIEGNKDNEDLQTLLDNAVEGITAPVATE